MDCQLAYCLLSACKRAAAIQMPLATSVQKANFSLCQPLQGGLASQDKSATLPSLLKLPPGIYLSIYACLAIWIKQSQHIMQVRVMSKNMAASHHLKRQKATLKESVAICHSWMAAKQSVVAMMWQAHWLMTPKKRNVLELKPSVKPKSNMTCKWSTSLSLLTKKPNCILSILQEKQKSAK